SCRNCWGYRRCCRRNFCSNNCSYTSDCASSDASHKNRYCTSC
ncbi:hypothetical protein CP8484711_2251B, partial [Chlamydia psittaci 84-8471/1]